MNQEIFDHAAQLMLERHNDDEQGRMLHAPGLKAAGRFYGFADRHSLVVKLPAERVAELIRADVGRPCEPRKGRPMREWVELSPADVDTCMEYLTEARFFVTNQQEKQS